MYQYVLLYHYVPVVPVQPFCNLFQQLLVFINLFKFSIITLINLLIKYFASIFSELLKVISALVTPINLFLEVENNGSFGTSSAEARFG